MRQRYETPLTIILIVVGIVLLSACANLANLFLARATARQPEFSLRLALGASRWRVARQLIVESVLLAIAGSALGLIVAQWGSALLVRQLATTAVPVVLNLTIDWRVLRVFGRGGAGHIDPARPRAGGESFPACRG